MIAEIANGVEPPRNDFAGLDTNDSHVIVVVNVEPILFKETPMKHIARLVTNWRVEMILMAMVLSLGATARAQTIAADWCSDVPVLTYTEEVNLCMGDSSDCYMCVVWLRD